MNTIVRRLIYVWLIQIHYIAVGTYLMILVEKVVIKECLKRLLKINAIVINSGNGVDAERNELNDT